jgi:hypothetical protein
MPDAFDITGFGNYLAGPDVDASYREQLRQLGEPNYSLAEPPRLVGQWRADPHNAARGDWSPRQVESWLRTRNYDGQDLEDFQVLAGAFIRERSA